MHETAFRGLGVTKKLTDFYDPWQKGYATENHSTFALLNAIISI
jgi:hypothetical protein